jgi:nitroreductase
VETWDAIRARRNIRSFADRPIAPERLDRILEAGRRAPSSINWQPWDFVVVTDRQALRDLAGVFPQGAFHVPGSAATVALVSPLPVDDMRRDWIQYDLGQATMSMMLAAADLGIGSGHAAVSDQDLARRLLRFPTDRFLAYMLSLGYPADRPLRPIERPRRRPFEEVVHRGVW